MAVSDVVRVFVVICFPPVVTSVETSGSIVYRRARATSFAVTSTVAVETRGAPSVSARIFGRRVRARFLRLSLFFRFEVWVDSRRYFRFIMFFDREVPGR